MGALRVMNLAKDSADNALDTDAWAITLIKRWMELDDYEVEDLNVTVRNNHSFYDLWCRKPWINVEIAVDSKGQLTKGSVYGSIKPEIPSRITPGLIIPIYVIYVLPAKDPKCLQYVLDRLLNNEMNIDYRDHPNHNGVPENGNGFLWSALEKHPRYESTRVAWHLLPGWGVKKPRS
jgi:hypothetical protein